MTAINEGANKTDQANHDSSQTPYKETYVAYLDILGFSNLVNNNNDEKNLIDLVRKFWDGFNKSVDESRTVSDMGEDIKIDIRLLSFRLYSDSIIVWSKDGSYKSFRFLLGAITCLLSYGIQNGFPLRGAINYGGVVSYKPEDNKTTFFRNDSLYGLPIVEAVEIEKALNWSGCIITPSAWQHAMMTWNKVNTATASINDFTRRFPYLIWYPVPFKTGNIYAVTVNWNCEAELGKLEDRKAITSALVDISFSSCRNHSEYSQNTTVITKIEATKHFLDYVCSLSLVRLDSPENVPTVDAYYANISNKDFMKQIRKSS